MLTVAEALEAVLQRAAPLPARAIPLGEARGLILAADVRSDLDLPPFAKALVDGYAIRAADLTGPGTRLRLGEEIAAGRTPTRPLDPGEAACVLTGAPVPDGADAVIMHEQTRREGDWIVFERGPATPGEGRLDRGRELRRGEIVASTGERITAARAGVLASVGCVRPIVIPRPRVAILPTGDELVEPEHVPGPGQIRNSNASLLRALVEDAGAEAQVLPIARDEPDALRALLIRGLEADVLLATGGVSAGSRDLVPPTLADLGVAPVFHKIRLKPGKPLLFAIGPDRPDHQPGPYVFGLPGNPVSGLVGFVLFVRPLLEVLRGEPPRPPRTQSARLATPFTHKGDRPTYHPARLLADEADGLPRVEPLTWAGSADLRTVARADVLAVFPAGSREYAAGDPIDILPL